MKTKSQSIGRPVHQTGEKRRWQYVRDGAFGVLMLCVPLVDVAAGDALYFVYGQPNADGPDRRPFPTVIYRLSELTKSFSVVWEMRAGERTENVRVYPSAGIVAVSEGSPPPFAVNLIATQDLRTVNRIDFSQMGILPRHFRYYYVLDGSDQIDVTPYGSIPVSADSLQEPDGRALLDEPSPVRVDVHSSKTVSPHGDLRLAGPRSEYGGGDDDVVVLRDIFAPQTRIGEGADVKIDGFPVPDTVPLMRHSFGWVVIAHEADYQAILSVPNQNGLTAREVLLYNRLKKTWSSVLIPGAETTPRIINDRLAATIADQSSQTDYVKRTGVAPILREDCVIIEPLQAHFFTVHLGIKGEILWLENGSAYYRVQDSLFSARIADDDFKDRKLILTDPRVEHIHWAFRGGEGTGPK